MCAKIRQPIVVCGLELSHQLSDCVPMQLLTSTMKSLIQSLETEGERMVQAEQQQQVSGSDHIHYRPGTSVTMRSHNPEFDGMVATVVRLVDEEQKVYEVNRGSILLSLFKSMTQ